jgi:hypothetical protein
MQKAAREQEEGRATRLAIRTVLVLVLIRPTEIDFDLARRDLGII